MKLLDLNILDFGPFSGLQQISFDGRSPLIMITAQYTEAAGRSNRAGKSSVLDAIVYLLYGECRVREVEYIHYGAPAMIVDGKFQLENGDILFIKRGRTSKNEAIFEVNGQTGAKLQSEIDKIIGISYKDFTTTNYFQQLDMHSFMEAGATEKQKLLSQWLGNDYWKKYEDAVKGELDELTGKISKATAELAALESLEIAVDAEARLAAATTQRDVLTEQLKQLEAYHTELVTKKANMASNSVDKVIATATSDMRRAEDAMSHLQTQLNNYHRWFKDQETKLRALELAQKQYNVDDHKKATALVKEAEAKMIMLTGEGLQLRIKHGTLTAASTGVCPILGEPCSRVSLETLCGQINTIDAACVQKAVEIAQVKEIRDAVTTVQDAGDKLAKEIASLTLAVEFSSKATEAALNPDELQKLIEAHRTMIENCKKSIQGAQVGKTDTSGVDRELSVSDEKTRATRTELSKVAGVISVLEYQIQAEIKRKSNVSQLQATVKELNQKHSELLILQYVFSKNGVPLVQLENTFSQLESEINAVLEFLNADCRVAFSSFKELTTKESECSVCKTPYPSGAQQCGSCGATRKLKRKEDMSIRLIYSNGVEADFASDSGGGKALISLAIRPALARVLQRGKVNPCRILMLDEVFANFDAYNQGLVMDAMEKLFVDRLGFSQVLFITHHSVDSYGHKFDELRVTREGTESKVGWV